MCSSVDEADWFIKMNLLELVAQESESAPPLRKRRNIRKRSLRDATGFDATRWLDAVNTVMDLGTLSGPAAMTMTQVLFPVIMDTVYSDVCTQWATNELDTPIGDTPYIPPCTTLQVELDPSFETDAICQESEACAYYHPDAVACYRSHTPGYVYSDILCMMVERPHFFIA